MWNEALNFALKKACKSFPETTLRTKFLCTEDLGAASFAQTDENEDFLHRVGVYTPSALEPANRKHGRYFHRRNRWHDDRVLGRQNGGSKQCA